MLQGDLRKWGAGSGRGEPSRSPLLELCTPPAACLSLSFPRVQGLPPEAGAEPVLHVWGHLV